MNHYLINGVSGSGKTTVGARLEKMGYEVVDADRIKNIFVYVDKNSNEVVDYIEIKLFPDKLHEVDYIWNREILLNVLNAHEGERFFVVGSANRVEEFFEFFDLVFILKTNSDVVRDRLLARNPDKFLKNPSLFDSHLNWIDFLQDRWGRYDCVFLDSSTDADVLATSIVSIIDRFERMEPEYRRFIETWSRNLGFSGDRCQYLEVADSCGRNLLMKFLENGGSQEEFDYEINELFEKLDKLYFAVNEHNYSHEEDRYEYEKNIFDFRSFAEGTQNNYFDIDKINDIITYYISRKWKSKKFERLIFDIILGIIYKKLGKMKVKPPALPKTVNIVLIFVVIVLYSLRWINNNFTLTFEIIAIISVFLIIVVANIYSVYRNADDIVKNIEYIKGFISYENIPIDDAMVVVALAKKNKIILPRATREFIDVVNERDGFI